MCTCSGLAEFILDTVVEVFEERECLSRCAGLGGNDEERPRQVQTVGHALDGSGVRAVQYAQPDRAAAKRVGEHLGRET